MLDRRLRAAPFRRSAVGCDHNGHRPASIGACAFEKNRRTSFRATAARAIPAARVVPAASDFELMTNRASDVLSTSILWRGPGETETMLGEERAHGPVEQLRLLKMGSVNSTRARVRNVASVLQGQSRCSPLIAPCAKHRAGERLTGTAPRPAVVDWAAT